MREVIFAAALAAIAAIWARFVYMSKKLDSLAREAKKRDFEKKREAIHNETHNADIGDLIERNNERFKQSARDGAD